MNKTMTKRLCIGLLFTFFLAWGMDGSGGHALSSSQPTRDTCNTSNIFTISPSNPSTPNNGEPFTYAYPRLGMWWPNTWEQPVADIARYDWVIYGDWNKENLPAIKALNPNQQMLNSTNACELSFNADADAEPWENEDVLAIPSAWFLTQVGTTLTQAVNASTTAFHVAALTATDGEETYDLFVPGDTALIGGESVYIDAVNEGTNTLTVQRGYVRPASSHASGERIAAHITFWPNSWVLNVSTLSPTAVVSATLGAERWADYNARRAISLLSDPIWDGILLDRSDSNESWLIGNSTARTIDPDQSNTLLSDYSAFNAAWNAGLRQYESKIREAVGDERIIFVNWGMPNYDLLNGNNFEGFPDDEATAYGTLWGTTVFGPWQEKGSYFDWLEQAQQPNLTMIETYEDDGGPDAIGDGSYDNPCEHPGFTPNYRKMRFGLATALLNDGFFSYEINTNGHGSLCLLWFDEYDNAGVGRGYLGQPSGPARRALPALTTPNLISGGGFESQSDLDQWDLWADTSNGYSATLALDTTTSAAGNTSAKTNVLQTNGVSWRISYSFEPFNVISGAEYTLSFWAKADHQRSMAAWVQRTQDPWDTWLEYETFSLSDTWQPYEFSAVASGSDPDSGLNFGMGQEAGSVWLDDVHLQQGSRDVWRRDYYGGLALVNATLSVQTIPLGGHFRKIAGSQAPQVNDGSLVNEVTIPPLDGLILLRQENRIFLPLILYY
jgi:hypothetical protein